MIITITIVIIFTINALLIALERISCRSFLCFILYYLFNFAFDLQIESKYGTSIRCNKLCREYERDIMLRVLPMPKKRPV